MFAYKRYQLLNGRIRSLFIDINSEILSGRQKAVCVSHKRGSAVGIHPDYDILIPGCPPERVPNKIAERRWARGEGRLVEIEGCEHGGCGWYAFKDSYVAHAQVNLSWIEYVWGLVWLSGRIIEHEDGTLRAEYCELLALASIYPDIEPPVEPPAPTKHSPGVLVYIVKDEAEGWDKLEELRKGYERDR